MHVLIRVFGWGDTSVVVLHGVNDVCFIWYMQIKTCTCGARPRILRSLS